MPIEFQCPFCQATIRVPDSARGGKGRCPQCTVRITVPKKTTLPPITELPAFEPVAEEQPVVLQEMNDPPETDSPPVFATESTFASRSVAVAFDPDALENSRNEELPNVLAAPVRRKINGKQKRLRHWTIYGAAILLIGLIAAGLLISSNTVIERLSGELIAGSAESMELSPVMIGRSRIELPADEVTELLKKLEHSPVPLNSSSSHVQLKGTPNGLEVSISAGTQSQFYRVNLKGNESVRQFLLQNEARLEIERTQEVDREVSKFFTAYQDVLAKRAPSDSITVFRDSLALPSLTRGFGHQLVAAYGRGLYRCVYEDRDGGLYFMLPPGVTEFEVIGRTHPDGRIAVPAAFRVTVQGEIAVAARPVGQKGSKTTPKLTPKTGSDDSGTNGDDPPGKN